MSNSEQQQDLFLQKFSILNLDKNRLQTVLLIATFLNELGIPRNF
jgi:hypothetical protein